VFFYFTGPYPTIGFSKETEAGNRRLVRSFLSHDTKGLLLTFDWCRLLPALRLRIIPLPTRRQPGLPPQVPLRVGWYPSQEAGKERYRSVHQSTAYRWPRDGIQYEVGSTSTIIVSDQVLKYRTGSWSLDPLAPQVLPAQDLVQMYGQGDTKRRCCDYRWSKKKVPATAMFRSRHGKTYMQRSALSEGRLSVPLRRFARRRAAEVRFSSMWSVHGSVFIICYLADPVPDFYRSYEGSTY
jgi:hypothetical protein